MHLASGKPCLAELQAADLAHPAQLVTAKWYEATALAEPGGEFG